MFKLVVVTKQERECGVLVDSSMKMSTQCAAAMKRVNYMLFVVRKGIENKITTIVMQLYYVCYGQTWITVYSSGHHISKPNTVKLEKVQKRPSRMIRGLELIYYEQC